MTDMMGKKTYVSCLTLPEPLREGQLAIKGHQEAYAPKSLVILSYHPCLDVFRSCLCALYNIWIQGSPISLNR